MENRHDFQNKNEHIKLSAVVELYHTAADFLWSDNFMKHKRNHNLHSTLILIITTACLITVGFAVFIRSADNSALPRVISVSESSNETSEQRIPYISENDNDTSEQQWYLILVNDKNKIPENYNFELTELNNGKCVDSRIYPDLQAMFDDMRSEGIYPVVSEGFRTADEQKQMMSDKIDAYLDMGYSQKDAKNLAEQAVAAVGKSEHQLGLAVDINADESCSTNEEVYVWLAENAYKYGFILRYPADKTDITGIEYEPWHYRYVGKKAAEEIYSQGICLEDYLREE